MEEMTWEAFKKNMARYEAEEREDMGVKAFKKRIAYNNLLHKQVAYNSPGPRFFEQHQSF